MTERQYAVAIDGPSGAGKSTLARAAAEALHILYVTPGPSIGPSACICIGTTSRQRTRRR